MHVESVDRDFRVFLFICERKKNFELSSVGEPKESMLEALNSPPVGIY